MVYDIVLPTLGNFAGSSNWHLKWEGHRKWDFEVGTSHRTRGVHGKKMELSSKPPLIPRLCIQISQNIEWNLDVWSEKRKSMYDWWGFLAPYVWKEKLLSLAQIPLFFIDGQFWWFENGSQMAHKSPNMYIIIHYNKLLQLNVWVRKPKVPHSWAIVIFEHGLVSSWNTFQSPMVSRNMCHSFWGASIARGWETVQHK